MNDIQRSELDAIRAEQQLLRVGLARLDERLERLEATDKPVGASPPVVSLVQTPPSVPPPAPARAAGVPPPLPPVLAMTGVPPTVPVAPPLPQAKPESLEMRIGTTWFVRVGIVLLVTSLAFLGNFLYHNIVPHLGPGAKVAALYLVAGAVTGVGAWLERSRQGRESARVRQYAQIVLAGGLAAVYYVTYAAHYYERLRVIPGSLLAGVLLLGWAAFMVWLAERRASETLATVAILLGFYASAINEGVAGFTLVSNLFLALGATFLLRRHLWRVFPFASLLATYGSYVFWQYVHSYLGLRGLDMPPTHGGTRFWTECAFLLVYWSLFTWAVFTTRAETLPSARRAAFAGLNNGAFFLLTTWLVLGEGERHFWQWSLGFGVVLIALSELARRSSRRPGAPTEGAFQLQGILLVTLGFVTYFSGWQLSLILAVQSVALLVAAGRRRSTLLLGLAYVVALLSFVWTVNQWDLKGTWRWWTTGLGESGFFLVAAWWSERLRGQSAAQSLEVAGPRYVGWIAWVPLFFASLALAVGWWLLNYGITDMNWYAPVFALTAVGLSALVYPLRIRSLPTLALGYVLLAFIVWFVYYMDVRVIPWWSPLLMLGSALPLGHWWLRRAPADSVLSPRLAGSALIVAATLCAWTVVTRWMDPWSGGAFTLAAAWSGFAVVVFAAGLLLRERLYRWLGLLVLAVTLLRVVFVDIWQLGSLERAVSAFVLSITLLGLGYLYNRYHDRWQNLL